MKKNKAVATLASATLLASTALSQAALTVGEFVSISFRQDNAAAVPSGAAVIGQTGDVWNDIQVTGWDQPVNGTYALNGVDGLSSGISLTLAGEAGSHGYNGSNLPVYQSGFFLDQNDVGGGATITFSGFTSGTIIDLYLYAGAGHTTGEGASFTFGGNTLTAVDSNVNENSYVQGVNFVKFSNLVADSNGIVTGTWTKAPGQSYSVLAGAQIVAVPETSTTLLGGLSALALLRRRRK